MAAFKKFFMDGFDQYRFTSGERPARLLSYAEYTMVGGNFIMVSGRIQGDKDGRALQVYGSSFSRDYYWRSPTITVGFACHFNERGGLLKLDLGTEEIVLWNDPDTGMLSCNGVEGYVIPVKQRWYYYELNIDRASGVVKVYVNGRLDITVPLMFSVIDAELIKVTLNPQKVTPYEVVDGAVVPPPVVDGQPVEVKPYKDTVYRSFDDLYINSDLPLGPVQVTTRFPTDYDIQQWLKSDPDMQVPPAEGEPPHPSNTDFILQNDRVDELERYIYANVNGQEDRYYSSKVTPDQPILRIGMASLARRASPDPITFVQFIDGQAVKNANLGVRYRYEFVTMDATGYTANDVTQSRFGIKVEK